MHFVYLIYNTKTKKFYLGETDNLSRRLKQHRLGMNKSTKFYCEYWHYVYAEIYKSKNDAKAREKRLKSHGSGMVEIKKRIKHSTQLVELIDNKTEEGKR